MSVPVASIADMILRGRKGGNFPLRGATANVAEFFLKGSIEKIVIFKFPPAADPFPPASVLPKLISGHAQYYFFNEANVVSSESMEFELNSCNGTVIVRAVRTRKDPPACNSTSLRKGPLVLTSSKCL